MSAAVLSAAGLGKRYRLPRRETTAMGRVRAHFKEFFGVFAHTDEDSFWALKDVSFELRHGDILGVLGKNGSGKSTMLKILSGVTTPTAGRAVVRGRVGSLLEVGTGFHPDLTGRQNVFLNGALLGMSQAEIRRKFDEIVDFSGIEAFIDVPVKRYSSGMYVRLAYAVASHLDTDILILDEVLAVGDAQFRKKSTENIERVASEGRTILFVSHNITSVTNLCTRGLILSQGRAEFQGPAQEAVTRYMQSVQRVQTRGPEALAAAPAFVDLRHARGYEDRRPHPVLTSIETSRGDGTPTRTFRTGDTIRIRIGYDAPRELSPYFQVLFIDQFGNRMMAVHTAHSGDALLIRGAGTIECEIPDIRLVTGEYALLVDYGVMDEWRGSLDCIPDATSVYVDTADYVEQFELTRNQGVIAQRSRWTLESSAR